MKLLLVLLVLQMLSAPAAQADRVYPTPEITRIESLDSPGAVTWGMRGELGDTGHYVGLVITCKTDGSRAAEVTTFFSSFPGIRHPVQLAVRSADGRSGRFGPVVTGGPQSGFHSPQIKDPVEAERFLRLALKTGSLVSNGYRSFWNRVGEARNREVFDAFLACAKGRGR